MNTEAPLQPAPIAQPWHAGERAVQARVGVHEKLAQLGPRVIRPYMPDQHRDFFAQLPFIVVGSVDEQGQPWASILAHPPGFVQSPDASRLALRAAPGWGDPLRETLAEGAPIGLLGIEPHTRRRNRMNGTVRALSEAGFSVQVGQSFGNCPKYIQAREPVYLADVDAAAPRPVHEGEQLDDAARALVREADLLFIATAYLGMPGQDDGPAYGVDVSHRGGRPGFVRVDRGADGRDVLTVPDFLGNFFFNTLGNLAANPRAGLLFVDFARGDLLYLAVDAEIVWDGPEVAAFEGAQRLVRLTVRRMRRVPGVLPLRWGAAKPSPALEGTGSWTV